MKTIRLKTGVVQNSVLIATIVFCIAFLCVIRFFDWNSINSYSVNNTEAIHYISAEVLRIDSETLEFSEDEHCYLGEQQLTVRLTEGEEKGSEIQLNNYLTRTHNIHAKEGSKIIICADTPENAAPYYTVFNYDRASPLFLLIVLFAGAVFFVGRSKGIRTLLGMGFTLLMIVFFTVQAIYHGFDPVGITIVTVLITTGISLLLLSGCSRKTVASLLGTLSGVGVTGVIFALFSALLHLSGYNMDTAETLLLVGNATGLSIRPLLLVSVLISALGAVMDVAVSLAAAMEELISVHPNIDQKSLLRSGLNIGKDMIGTMSNTLILAYAGTALNTMLCLIAYGYQMNQLFSSDYLTIELTQALCATIGVVLTVPITAAIAALLYTRMITASPHKKKGVIIKNKERKVK